jgi:uncharacterized membrane protein YkoI
VQKEITMKVLLVVFYASVLCAGEKKLKMEDLPPAVQSAVKEQTKSATLVGLAKETEKGQTLYEVETKVDGKTRDMMLDKTGAIQSVEEEVDLDSIPAPAKAAIQKRAAGGTVEKVEKLTEGSNVSYEAAIKSKSGKKSEAAVNADGSVHK